MKLTWHIVKKDFQRLWVPLALWSLLLAAKVAIGWTMLEGSSVTLGWSANAEQMWLNRMTLYSNLLIALDILVNYVLAGVLIHEDALLGTQLFWRTRPISGARLLGAKLLGAALMFGAVPVLVWLPWWLHCSYGRAQIASAVIEVLFWQMLITLPALLMAALTDQFGRFLAWTLVLFGGIWVLAGIMLAYLRGAESLLGAVLVGQHEPPDGGILTPLVLTTVFAVTGAVVVLSHQFLSRRFKTSVALTVMIVGLALLIFLPWPGDGSKLWPKLPAKPSVIAANVTATLAPAMTRTFGKPDANHPNEGIVFVSVPVELGGIPEDIGIEDILPLKQVWQLSDGTKVERTRGDASSFDYVSSRYVRLASWKALGLPSEKFNAELYLPPTSSFLSRTNERRKAHGLSPLPARTLEAPSQTASLAVGASWTRSVAARMRKEAAGYSLNFQLRLSRAEKEFEVPATKGDRVDHEAATLRVFEVKTFGSQMVVKISESWPDNSPIYGIVRIRDSTLFSERGRGDYALVNRSRGNLSEREQTALMYRLRIGTVVITRATLAFAPANDLRDGEWVDEPNWFEGVTLAKVGYVEAANFTREVKVDKFELAPTENK